MARSNARKPLVASLLDRLIDDDPQSASEPARSGAHDLEELRAAVRRDLENLLNTRRRALPWPSDDSESRGSVLAYGLPDVTGLQLGTSAARASFLQGVEDLIRRFEPRFKRVKVTPRAAPNPLDRTLHFSIEAEVHAEPVPEPVAFDTVVEPVSRTMRVELSDARG
jgi:type VI secretion system protein ImpF